MITGTLDWFDLFTLTVNGSTATKHTYLHENAHMKSMIFVYQLSTYIFFK